MQDCSNSIANALELLQSCTKPSIYCWDKGPTETEMPSDEDFSQNDDTVVSMSASHAEA